MIIIEHDAETKLAQALERMRHEGADARCLYFYLPVSDATARAQLRAQVIASATNRLGEYAPQLYLCEDGDIFVLAPQIPGRQGRLVMLDVGEFVARPVTEE